MVNLSKAKDFALTVSLNVAKQRLASIANAEPMGKDGITNPFEGKLLLNGTVASLTEPASTIKDKYIEVELRESENETWVRITVGPTITALAIFALLLAIAPLAIVLESQLLGYSIPLMLILPYIHFLGYGNQRQKVGMLIDPLYFNSPAALADSNKSMLWVTTFTNNAFMWIGIATAIGVIAWAALRML